MKKTSVDDILEPVEKSVPEVVGDAETTLQVEEVQEDVREETPQPDEHPQEEPQPDEVDTSVEVDLVAIDESDDEEITQSSTVTHQTVRYAVLKPINIYTQPNGTRIKCKALSNIYITTETCNGYAKCKVSIKGVGMIEGYVKLTNDMIRALGVTV